MTTNGKLLPLERQTPTIKGKTSGFVVIKTKSVFEITGGKSPIRFPSSEKLEFIVKSGFASIAVDPNTFYALHRLNGKKNEREMVISTGRASPVGATLKTDATQGTLPVEFSHYGASSLKVSAGTLPPGEYALTQLFGQPIFCFGVD